MFQEEYQIASPENDFNSVKSMQVLIIDDIEIIRKNQKETLLEKGSLHVLFVPEYSRFVLQLNNWFYALVKDLPIRAICNPTSHLCSYVLPTHEGEFVLGFGKQSPLKEVHTLQALLRSKAKVVYEEVKSAESGSGGIIRVSRENSANTNGEGDEIHRDVENNMDMSDPDHHMGESGRRANKIKGTLRSFGRQLSSKILSWKKNTVTHKYEALGYGKLSSAFDEDLTVYIDREEVQKAIVNSMEVIKKSKFEDGRVSQEFKQLTLTKKITSNASDDAPKSPAKLFRKMSSANYIEKKDIYIETEADLKAMLRTRIDLEERIDGLRMYIVDGIEVDNTTKMEYECKKLQLDELDELIKNTEVELEELHVQLFGSVAGGKARKLHSMGSAHSIEDKEGIFHHEVHLEFADQQGGDVAVDALEEIGQPRFSKMLSKRLPEISENDNDGYSMLKVDSNKGTECSKESDIPFTSQLRRHHTEHLVTAGRGRMVFDGPERKDLVNANDLIMTKLAMRDLKLNEEKNQPGEEAIGVIDLEKKASQRQIEEKGENDRQGAEVEKFVLPELGFWTRTSIKIRSRIPEDLTCHHVWWVIHLAVTGVLLWLYFTNNLGISAGTIAIFELLIGVVFRNEIIITILHFLFAYIPIGKRFFNRMLHCIGGIHTSAALMVVLWLMIAMVKEITNTAVMVTGALLFALVVILSVGALPPIRRKYHNSFEYIHRFLGWTGLGILIAHVVLREVDTKGISVDEAFRGAPVLMTLFITVIIFLPWVLVGRTRVSWKQPSSLLTVATFKGTYNPYGTVSRVSFNGLEWHAFAMALVDADKDTHSLVIAKAGDWTGRVSDGCAKGTLPEKIWTRKMKGIGFMYSIHAYRKVLLVCTGSGIAPALPYIKNPIPTTCTHVLWIAKKHRQVFGDFLMDLVENTAPNYTLHDTATHGRPSVDLVIEWFYRIKAEAVFVVSNEPFTDQIVNGCWKKAVPAFGALFDS